MEIKSHKGHPLPVVLGERSHPKQPTPKLTLYLVPQVVLKQPPIHLGVQQCEQVEVQVIGLVATHKLSAHQHLLQLSEALSQL